MTKKSEKLIKHIKDEFIGWKFWEFAWLIVACSVICVLSIYWNDTIMGIISATTGVACVVCTGKGKLSAYIFGAVNTLLYAIIAYNAKFYGEVMLNALYYFPLQFYGLYVWSRNMNEETKEVNKKQMNLKGKCSLVVIVLLATIIYGYLLKLIGGQFPYIDALSTVISVVAMIISIKMYAEQWLLWIAVNIVTVIMWAIAFVNGNDSIATLLMWIVYLVNAVVMYFKWKKEAMRNEI